MQTFSAPCAINGGDSRGKKGGGTRIRILTEDDPYLREIEGELARIGKNLAKGDDGKQIEYNPILQQREIIEKMRSEAGKEMADFEIESIQFNQKLRLAYGQRRIMGQKTFDSELDAYDIDTQSLRERENSIIKQMKIDAIDLEKKGEESSSFVSRVLEENQRINGEKERLSVTLEEIRRKRVEQFNRRQRELFH